MAAPDFTDETTPPTVTELQKKRDRMERLIDATTCFTVFVSAYITVYANDTDFGTLTDYLQTVLYGLGISTAGAGIITKAMIPSLVAQVGGADALSVAWSMFVGSHLVDISPLSTTGALCIAWAPATEDHRLLFKKLLAWGLCMAVVGALMSYVCFGLLRTVS